MITDVSFNKKFCHPCLRDPRYELALQLLIAGTGFYRKHNMDPSYYVIQSHKGKVIGSVDTTTISRLIYFLRQNRPKLKYCHPDDGWDDVTDYEPVTPMWFTTYDPKRRYGQPSSSASMTYGLHSRFAHVHDLLVERFHNAPVEQKIVFNRTMGMFPRSSNVVRLFG